MSRIPSSEAHSVSQGKSLALPNGIIGNLYGPVSEYLYSLKVYILEQRMHIAVSFQEGMNEKRSKNDKLSGVFIYF